MRLRFLFTIFLCLLFPLPTFAAGGDDTDFDDDGHDDYAVYRPATGMWFIQSTAKNKYLELQWGLPGDIPLPGQYTDNLRPDIAVYRPSNGWWYIREWDNKLAFDQTKAYQFGGFPGDIPVPCDYNGNSVQDIGIYRAGVWYVLYSRDHELEDVTAVAWGGANDIPVPRDYDNDGECDYAVYRNGAFHVLLSTSEFTESATIALGNAGDIPISGEFDRDNLHDFAVYRPGNPSMWYIRESRKQGLTTLSIPWGLAGDIPLQADLDGDDKSDIIVYRPTEGNYYALTSRSHFTEAVVQSFGLPGDIPLGRRSLFQR